MVTNNIAHAYVVVAYLRDYTVCPSRAALLNTGIHANNYI